MARNSQLRFIEKVTYKLHPTFEKPTRGMDPCCGLREIDNSDQKAPFKVEEEGWGEFDLGVTLHW